MHPVIAWFVGAAYITYRYGYQCKMLPKPHRYIGLTAAISIASIIGYGNQTVGTLFAYAVMLSAMLYGETHKSDITCDSVNPVNISTGQSSNTQQSGGFTGRQNAPNPTPLPNPSPLPNILQPLFPGFPGIGNLH